MVVFRIGPPFGLCASRVLVNSGNFAVILCQLPLPVAQLGRGRSQYSLKLILLLGEGQQQIRLAAEQLRARLRVSGRAARTGTRRVGLGMPRGRPRGLRQLPFARHSPSRARGKMGSGPSY
jgi:hypothetical protein